MNSTTTPSPSPTRNSYEPIEPSFFPTASPTDLDDKFNYVYPILLIGITTISSLGFCYIGMNLAKDATGQNIFPDS